MTAHWRAAAAIGVAIAIVAGVSSSFRVAQDAGNIAGSEPYCIQTARNADYMPTRTWLDLSIFRMWAARKGGMYMQHHAVLAVGDERNPRLFHWSYRAQKFVAGVLNDKHEGYGPTLTCVPQPHFATNLSLFSSPADQDYVRFSSHEAYRIPRAYQAKWSGGSGRFLVIFAIAPDFSAPPVANGTVSGPDTDRIFVEWNPQWLLNLLNSDGGTVTPTTEFGLQKKTIISHGKDSKRYETNRYWAYADGQPNGINTTLISCSIASVNNPQPCQHRFLNNGRHFVFRHSPDDVPAWRDMQKRVLDLFASFEVGTNAPNASP